MSAKRAAIVPVGARQYGKGVTLAAAVRLCRREAKSRETKASQLNQLDGSRPSVAARSAMDHLVMERIGRRSRVAGDQFTS